MNYSLLELDEPGFAHWLLALFALCARATSDQTCDLLTLHPASRVPGGLGAHIAPYPYIHHIDLSKSIMGISVFPQFQLNLKNEFVPLTPKAPAVNRESGYSLLFSVICEGEGVIVIAPPYKLS
jgi:hypothetical protein